MILLYRKQSVNALGKAAGNVPGIFDSEFGPIGVLLGTEAEEEQRWAPLLARRPYLVLNPARAATQIDPMLVRLHPELQVAAWQRGFEHMERTIESRTWRCGCAFVRADAPLQEGGAGNSLLIEPHRTVLAPRWGPAVFVVETLHPGELVGRRLPGWRTLTIDERVRSALLDHDILMHEDIEKGPRYHVWNFQLSPIETAVHDPRKNWDPSPDSLRYGMQAKPQPQQRKVGDVTIVDNRAFFMPLFSRDGRSIYVAVTSGGKLVLWDVPMKKELFSSNMHSEAVTALGASRTSSQFIIAAVTPRGLAIRVFQETQHVLGIFIDSQRLPTDEWPTAKSIHAERTNSQTSLDSFAEQLTAQLSAAPTQLSPSIRYIHQTHVSHALCVLDIADGEHVPLGAIIDFETGIADPVDIYGSGPAESDDEDDTEDSHSQSQPQWWGQPSSPISLFDYLEEDKQQKKTKKNEDDEPKPIQLDELVATYVVEQRFQERSKPQKVLLCLYKSNRICHLTLNDFQLHEQYLLEESASQRQRSDVPLCCASLPNPLSGSYHLVVSYESMLVRWWQVSLSSCRLSSHLTLTSAASQLALVEWPLQVPPPEKALKPRPQIVANTAPQQGSGGQRHRSAPSTNRAGSLSARGNKGGYGGTTARQSSNRPLAMAGVASLHAATYQAADRSDAQSDHPRLAFPHDHHEVGSIATGRESKASNHSKASVMRDRTSYAGRVSALKKSSTFGGAKDFTYVSGTENVSLLIVAFDTTGGMPIFLARGGRISKIYTCVDHFVGKSIAVDQLWVSQKCIAVQLSNGDIRHFEFMRDGEQISITELPIEP